MDKASAMRPELPDPTARVRGLRGLVGGDAQTWRAALVLATIAVALRLFFWAYTGRVWEDALITVLHSENAGRGLGLTHYHPGEPPTHGFTSPISVLVPLLADWFHPGWGLILIRLVSSVAAALSVMLLFGINRVYPGLRLPLPLIVAAAGYLAIEHHQMLWGMAGMETQLVVAILLWTLYAVQAQTGPLVRGLSLAACMYARPDYGFLVVIVGLVVLARGVRARALGPVFVTAVVAAAAYLPWIVFTTLYYGSPVPNTVLAKAFGYSMWTHDEGGVLRHLYMVPRQILLGIFAPQGPMFGGHGTGYRSPFAPESAVGLPPTTLAVGLMIAGGVVALRRRQGDLIPIYAFVLVYTAYYVFFVPTIFGWYTVPMNAVGALLVMKGVDGLLPLRVRARPKRLWVGTAVYLAVFAGMLLVTIPAERAIQTRIENRVRLQIGRYMAARHDPRLTVAAEPLGYLSYYGQVTTYDFPGLASRPVVAYLRAHPGAGMADMMRDLHPDYLLLRPSEYATAAQAPDSAWLRCDYVPERHWALSAADKRGILLVDYNIDTDFLLLRRRTGPASRAGAPFDGVASSRRAGEGGCR